MSIHVRTDAASAFVADPISARPRPTAEHLETLVSPHYVRPLQLEWSPHLAALAGIAVLVVLGGVLVARNRLGEQNALVTDTDDHHDEFVTDREHVQRLVRENGGRMKQSEIVNAVDWSKAKVSRLLAELEEEGRITKLRLGRENLICLPGEEPTASRSPEQPRNE